jgi:pyruvate kinase
MRKTKLVITVGPASDNDEVLTEILKLADAIRINASHNSNEERGETLKRVRRIAESLGRRIPVFLDLQGPKWRIGILEQPVPLVVGAIGGLYPTGTEAPTGLAWTAPLPHPELFQGAKVGQNWLLDDGALKLEVVEALPNLVKLKVVIGGTLKARKVIHPIGLDVIFNPLTPKDLVDAKWGVENGVDMFAQSFVRRGSDIKTLQEVIKSHGGNQPIIAKIEHPQALENLDEILGEAYGIMVARGDLGVELGVERVPALQKEIIRKTRAALKPVITATQMLESMIENSQPTRAEASDVANAIWDGTDAVMLSAESAAGKHPVEAVTYLHRIALDADLNYKPRIGRFTDSLNEKLMSRTDVSVAFAACRTAEEIGAKAIVVFTEGGGVARMVSRLAANVPVIGATTDLAVARRMGLMRGVRSMVISRVESSDEMVASVEKDLAKDFGIVAGDKVVMTLGLPLWKSGTTNTMKVVTY